MMVINKRIKARFFFPSPFLGKEKQNEENEDKRGRKRENAITGVCWFLTGRTRHSARLGQLRDAPHLSSFAGEKANEPQTLVTRRSLHS